MSKFAKVALPFIRKFNVIHIVFDQVLGEKHTKTHRFIAGAVVMATGVCIVKLPAFFHNIEDFSMLTDGLGNLVHAIGATPYIEALVAAVAVSE